MMHYEVKLWLYAVIFANFLQLRMQAGLGNIPLEEGLEELPVLTQWFTRR